jgi:hypothetical protein
MKTRNVFKSGIVAVAAILCFGFTSPKVKMLKQALTLQMPDGNGSNGAGVAYNPKKKLYYAVFAGNSGFPLSVFDKKGHPEAGIFTAGYDARGLWYNKESQSLEGNAYADFGYYRISVDKKGIPTGNPTALLNGRNQPNDNSIGAYNPKTGDILFRENETLYFYNKATGISNLNITLVGLPVAWENVNDYSVVYTGMKNREIGVFDYVQKRIYLFSIADGKYNTTLALPEGTPNPDMFNFSFCNDIFWLFNKAERKWYGYK